MNKPKLNLKKFLYSLGLIGLIFTSIVIYSIWDNNRVIVVKQDVFIKTLPESFEGYKILVISDLHGKEFGEHQKDLLSKVNNLDYDAIFIAGDMQESDNSGFEPLLDLLHGIKKKTAIYYTSGAWGPIDFNPATGTILPAGKVLQSEGLTLLNLPIKVSIGGEHIWFCPDFMYSWNKETTKFALKKLSDNPNNPRNRYYWQVINYQTLLLQKISAITQNDVMIDLTHTPLKNGTLDYMSDEPPYSLIIAGHYHGGQFRLPIIGAIYLPYSNSIIKNIFPNDKFISGLYVGKKTQQYISRGLGASGHIPLLKFRLFNTPEINLITLHNSNN